MIVRAGVVVAHGGGQCVQSLVERSGVGGEQGAPQCCQAGGVVEEDVDGAAAGLSLGATQRVGVVLGDEPVDFLVGLVQRHRPPLLNETCECGIDGVLRVGSLDQCGAVHDGGDQAVADQSLGEHGGDFGEAVA
jgi:hypothetical protein